MFPSLELNDLIILLPEILIALSALILLIAGVFSSSEKSFFTLMYGSLISCLLSLFLILFFRKTGNVFGDMLISNDFTIFCKSVIMAGSVFSIVIFIGFYKDNPKYKVQEFSPVFMLSLLGILLLVSANDLMSLYISIELQSLAFYILASFNAGDSRSSEAGLKYFITGSVASGLMLYGISFIYGFSGTTSFSVLLHLYNSTGFSTGVYIGLAIILAGLCFKISAAPFHMWTPDVYEGSPAPVTAFFAIVPKISTIAVICRLLIYPFGDSISEWQQIIVVVSVASMFISCLGAIRQVNIKRLLAYSSIGHTGYMLTGLVAYDSGGLEAILFYLVIYMVMSAGIFASIIMVRNKNGTSDEITTFSNLSLNKPFLSLLISALLLSMAGIPPFAGFFSKFFVFEALVSKGMYYLAIAGVISSIISAFYYIRIIKIMYFDEVFIPINNELRFELKVVALIAALFSSFLLFSPFIDSILSFSKLAALSILN